jgi:hypothetical protein
MTQSKNFGHIKYPGKTFFEFFSSISWGLFTGTKGEKRVLFGYSTGKNWTLKIFEKFIGCIW